MTIAVGGKTINGASIGVLVLESQFPRILGDGGNASTWPFPVLYQRVDGATPDAVVRGHAAGLVDRFIEAAKINPPDMSPDKTKNAPQAIMEICKADLTALVMP